MAGFRDTGDGGGGSFMLNSFSVGLEKAIKVLWKLIKKALLLLLKKFGIPIILIFIGSIFLVIIGTYILFGERGSMLHFNIDNIKTNTVESISADGREVKTFVATEVSEDHEIVYMYYKFMSIQSYHKTVDGGKTLLNFIDDTEDFVKYTDYHGKENIFYLNNHFLLSMDEIANRYMFRYPEQFIKPVHMDFEERKLLSLVDERGAVVALSAEYNAQGFRTDNKIPGIWDFGFASVLYYATYEKEDFVKGTYVKKDIIKNNEVVQIETEEPFRVAIPNTIKDVHVIENAVTMSGDIRYIYEMQDAFYRELNAGYSDFLAEYQDVTAFWYDIGIIVVPAENEDEEDTYIEVPLFKYRAGAVYEHIPIEIESEENLIGVEYIHDYLSNYKIYVPNNVMEDFNFGNRIEEAGDLLEKLRILNVFGGGLAFGSVGSSNLESGSRIATTSFEEASKYMSLYEKYGRMFGVDPHLLLAIAAQESSGNHHANLGKTGAVGLMQVEPVKNFFVRNASGFTVNIRADRNDLYDINTNVMVAAAFLKYSIDYFNGNVLMGLQGYNFGQLGLRNIVSGYAGTVGKTFEQVRDNHSDLGWMAHRKNYTRGGDRLYVERVLSYYTGNISELTGIKSTGQPITEFDPIAAAQALSTQEERRGFLQRMWSNVTDGMKKMVGAVSDFFTIEHEEKSHPHEYLMGQIDINSILAQVLSFGNMSDFYSSYDEIMRMEAGESNHGYDFLFLGNIRFVGGLGGGQRFIAGIAAGMEGFINPTAISYRITSPFGMRFHPIKRRNIFHEGIDLATPMGTPLYAVNNGTITHAGWMGGYGYTVDISMGDFAVRYAHLDRMDVSRGEVVVRGQRIGLSGNTGNSTGPHLHFELRYRGQLLNPALYFFK